MELPWTFQRVFQLWLPCFKQSVKSFSLPFRKRGFKIIKTPQETCEETWTCCRGGYFENMSHVGEHRADFTDSDLSNLSGQNHDNRQLALFPGGSAIPWIYWEPQWVLLNDILLLCVFTLPERLIAISC